MNAQSKSDVSLPAPRRAFLSGTDVLAELPLLMLARDRARGWTTAGYVSGYRGSPLAQFDRALEKRAEAYAQSNIVAKPGLNEDLAATAVWGSQQSGLFDAVRPEGVIGLWYGKGPGVDRTLDVFRHANAAGTDPKGGVLALMGDDHGAVSSTIAHQTEYDMMSVFMPVLAPGGIGEYVRFGLAGWEMSRASGAWIGFKCQTELVESSATVELDPLALPLDPVLPEGAGSLGLRAGDSPLVQEARIPHKLTIAQAFARLNGLDRDYPAGGTPSLGIVAAGKSWLDTLEALLLLGLTLEQAQARGIALRKPGLIWPLDPVGMQGFARSVPKLLFVEEKRPLIEDQARAQLYDLDRRPAIAGKSGFDGEPLLSALGELDPLAIARAILRCLPEEFARDLNSLPDDPHVSNAAPELKREPYFCSGCPHATSTRLPDGSRATTGIGCHMMMIDAPGRNTTTFTQMGGEGISWLGLAPFSDEKHIFVNMGDGTFFHSGLLAIRAAISSGVNATYKILFNDAVAMTGGQPHDGPLSVPRVVAQVLAEGAARVVVVAEDPGRLEGQLPAGVPLHHRDLLDQVQRDLREVPGITVIVYDQVCAAEKRRRRKAGQFPKPAVRAFINKDVCEGCGDCALQSGCIALEPVETFLGPKRQINQSACNVDLSCVKGFCPSFVTLPGAELKKATAKGAAPDVSRLPEPVLPHLDAGAYNIAFGGIGGSGVITVAETLAKAAYRDGLAVQGLSQTGLAQKNGAVVSHLRLAREASALHAVRIGPATADLVLGFDMVVAGASKMRPMIARGRTRLVLDDHLAPTAEVARAALGPMRKASQIGALRGAVAPEDFFLTRASALATALMGDAIAANMFLLGHAWQRGLIPVSRQALEAVIGKGRGKEMNLAAFGWGRISAEDPGAVLRAAGDMPEEEAAPLSVAQTIEAGAAHMRLWGGRAAERRFRKLVETARRAEGDLGEAFTRTVVASALRLLAYKDEYEVARLYRRPEFRKALGEAFDGVQSVRYHLAAPILARKTDARTGRPAKVELGRLAERGFAVLSRIRVLRGTPLDPFGRSVERQAERRLAADFAPLVAQLSAGLNAGNIARRTEIAALAQKVRGYGPVKEAAIAAYDAALAQALKTL